jgi:hypothetical protein
MGKLRQEAVSAGAAAMLTRLPASGKIELSEGERNA